MTRKHASEGHSASRLEDGRRLIEELSVEVGRSATGRRKGAGAGRRRDTPQNESDEVAETSASCPSIFRRLRRNPELVDRKAQGGRHGDPAKAAQACIPPVRAQGVAGVAGETELDGLDVAAR